MTYAGLLRQIEETVHALNTFGVGRGDTVALVLSSGPEMVAAFLAVATTATCAPLNPAYRERELEFYLSDLQPRAMIVLAGIDSPAPAIAEKRGIPVLELSPSTSDVAGVFSLRSREPLSRASAGTGRNDDIALVLHTSGTTSRPNMVPLTQANLCHSAHSIKEGLALTAEDRCLNVMPLFHIHGLVGAVLSSIVAGASVVCTPGFSTLQFFEWMDEFRPTWFTAVPTMHQAVLARARQNGRSKTQTSLRFIRSCSAALPSTVMAELERTFGVPVVEAYGMTEAAHQIACNPLPPGKRKTGSVGVPTGTEVAIVDEAGNRLGAGQLGEIVISGRNVMAGYLNNPSAHRSAMVGRRLRTGDQGVFDEEGYLFIKGRIKEVINRAGEKISPFEIDEVLMDHPAVAQAVAFAVPDRRLGEEVGAAVVLRESARVTPTELRDFAAKRLADFKLPRVILFVSEVPKGPTGKMLRIGLATRLGITEAARESPAESIPYVAPNTELESLLVKIWQEVLHVERVGIDDDFFDRGGDSLAASQLFSRVERATQARLSVAALFEAPTIRQFAGLLARPPDARDLPVVPIQPRGSRPPFFCVGGGPIYRRLARRLGDDRPFLGLQFPNTHQLPTPYQIRDVAAHLIKAVRSVQSEGPYFLGGWCMAGLIAYEMAQQLCAAGQKVGLLVLFDSVNSAGPSHRTQSQPILASFESFIRKIRFHWGVLVKLRPRALGAYVVDRFRTLAMLSKESVLKLRYVLAVRLNMELTESLRDPEFIERLIGLAYRPLPFAGRVVLFKRSLRPRGQNDDPRFGWGDLARGGLEIHEIPGDHRDMFVEPYVQITAEKLRAYLN